MIVYDFGISVKDYAAQGKYNHFPKIDLCPNCRRGNEVIGHGFYSRWCGQLVVWIKRSLCKAGYPMGASTFALLPTFLCQGIGKPVQVVESFLWHRSQGKTYKGCNEAIGRPDISYQRAQYWCKRWQKKISRIRGALPLKGMKKTLNIFQHLSLFFGLAQDS